MIAIFTLKKKWGTREPFGRVNLRSKVKGEECVDIFVLFLYLLNRFSRSFIVHSKALDKAR